MKNFALTNDNGKNQGGPLDKDLAKLKVLKDEILRDFKYILNKRGLQFFKTELKDIEVALKLRNALRSLIEQPPDCKSELKVSSIGSAKSSTNVISNIGTDVDDANSNMYGRPLYLHQTVVRIKRNEAGVEETIAYEQKSSRDPPKRTPSKRLCRREDNE